MKQILYAAAIMLWPLTLSASTEKADSTLRDVVVTGTRAAVPERAIAATVTTITDAQLT